MWFVIATLLLFFALYLPRISRFFISVVLGACSTVVIWAAAAMVKNVPFDATVMCVLLVITSVVWFIHLGEN